MGTKYLPSVKDHKATQRFQRKQQRRLAPAVKKAAAVPPPASTDKKV